MRASAFATFLYRRAVSVRSRTAENGDSTGFVVRRCRQCAQRRKCQEAGSRWAATNGLARKALVSATREKRFELGPRFRTCPGLLLTPSVDAGKLLRFAALVRIFCRLALVQPRSASWAGTALSPHAKHSQWRRKRSRGTERRTQADDTVDATASVRPRSATALGTFELP
jgi:hypothetical protein